MEPAAQGVARCDFLQPEIDLRALPRQAAGPQAIDQYADAVSSIGRLVHALDTQVLAAHLLTRLGPEP